MPYWLKNRKPHLQERMDDPSCDVEMLYNTYRHFSYLNPLLARWSACYERWIRPLLMQHQALSLLDIGFGGGDIPVQIGQWAKKDGFKLNITAIDPDPRAMEFVTHYWSEGQRDAITFRAVNADDLLREGKTYDITISNHLLHHLDDTELSGLLQQTQHLTRRRAMFNDIRRSDLGWMLFALGTLPIGHRSFIREDGLISIQRSYTYTELTRLLPAGWKLHRVFPYRLVAFYDAEST